MSERFLMGLLSGALLVAIASLAAYAADTAFWVSAHLPGAGVTDNREMVKAAKFEYGVATESGETLRVSRYEYGRTPPISLGEIKNPNSAYFHLKLRFRADHTEGYPNVFQTAPVNRGVRMELSGSTAALIVPDSTVPGGLKIIVLTTALSTGSWHTLDVEALNGSFIRSSLDEHPLPEYASAGFAMETSQLLVGGGFDATRPFRGRIEDVSLEKGNFHAPIQFGAIENPEHAYIHLKLRFRADSTEGFPNVFQTAPLNLGMRMELSGSTAAIIVRDLSEPNGFRSLVLTTALEKGRWYTLDVEALNAAFMRALLDGKLVKDFYGSSLSMRTSQLLVGGGFDQSRLFRGRLEDISLQKGNLSQPNQGLKWVYAALAFLTVMLSISLWRAVQGNPAVQKALAKLTVLAFPLVIVLGYFEYRLSFLNTAYFTKRVSLEHQLDNVEILVLGSSNTTYGVAPEAFSHPGFNLSFPGSGMYFDEKLGEKYYDKMPRLRMVVLTANYFTMGLDYSKFSQSWRQFFLRQNFNIPLDHVAWLPSDPGFWLEPRNFSRIALYGKEARGFVGDRHDALVDFIATPWGSIDGGDAPGDPSRDLGLKGAMAHNATVDTSNYDTNLAYWEKLIEPLQNRHIAVVVVVLPTDVSYHAYLDKSKFELMNHKLAEFAGRHQLKFADYTRDPRFSLTDYTFDMPDHLNARGAMKFSRILDDEVIRPPL